MADAKVLLTVEEAAVLCKVSALTIRRLISAGRLRAHRVGRAVRIDRADLLAATKGGAK